MNTIAIIDYGMGNLHSVSKAFEHVAPDVNVIVTSDAEKIKSADKVVLPGVGAMRDCMAEMKRLNVDALVKEVSKDRPFLGICVGMQALLERSEENNGVDSIGLFPGHVVRFEDNLKEKGQRLKVPHMGWNKVNQKQDHPLWTKIDNDARFYFVHSYYVPANSGSDERLNKASVLSEKYLVGQTQYGHSIAAAIARDNIFAVQFHPEKSQHSGLQLLKNFAHWSGKL